MKLSPVEGLGYVNEATGELIQALKDEKYPWRERKSRTLDMASLYRIAGMDHKADKAVRCSTWMEYLATEDGSVRKLHQVNTCYNRLCPICSSRKARLMAGRLIRVVQRVRDSHDGIQMIFLTLTARNVPGKDLRAALDQLTSAWYRLFHRRSFDRAVKGWFRAIEVTYNQRQDTYHPHIHALLVVEDRYFMRGKGSIYITQNRWCEMWQQCLRVAYKPVVDVRSTYTRGGQGSGKDMAAIVEAAKYATKDTDWLSPSLADDVAAKVLATYDTALSRKRMTAMGGWIADAARDLEIDVEADGDLVHVDDDGDTCLSPETAKVIEEYGWHRGVLDYLLRTRRQNPDYVGSPE